jgi:hypothetical protein
MFMRRTIWILVWWLIAFAGVLGGFSSSRQTHVRIPTLNFPQILPLKTFSTHLELTSDILHQYFIISADGALMLNERNYKQYIQINRKRKNH